MASPTLLNVEVGSVVCHWLSLIVEDNFATHDGIYMAVGRFVGGFYAYYNMIG